MPPSQQLLLAATLVFVAAVVQALLALKAGAWKQARAQFVLMALGFALQTGFIYLRGQEVHQCPIRSLPDIMVFIAWSIVLLYFLVGPAFRLSLLGVFTAPLVTIMQVMAFLSGFALYPPKGPINALVDITNFFTIDLGRPLHVFDADKVSGGVLTLRPGVGERFRALNGKDYTVRPSDCAIADAAGVQSMAGVIRRSSIRTKRVLREASASWPDRLRNTASSEPAADTSAKAVS